MSAVGLCRLIGLVASQIALSLTMRAVANFVPVQLIKSPVYTKGEQVVWEASGNTCRIRPVNKISRGMSGEHVIWQIMLLKAENHNCCPSCCPLESPLLKKVEPKG